MKKILVTGHKGFVGKNFISSLSDEYEVLGIDVDCTEEQIDAYCKECDFVFHFAGVNRPQNEDDFTKGNSDFTKKITDKLCEFKNIVPIVMTSSIQAALDNPYGKSKKSAEDTIFEYGEKNNTDVYVYRLPNVFGKWCRPNYNSVVATFCHNIANDIPIVINDENTELTLVYIDDVISEFKKVFNSEGTKDGKYYSVPTFYKIRLGYLAELIYSFKSGREKLEVADMSDAFTKKLYSTYLSYLPEDRFSYELKKNEDNRGSFTEIIRTADRGQFSVNIIKPGIVKGNHWHHTKNEKFLVVKGTGVIRFRNIFDSKIITYSVNDSKFEVVDIPVGYTHNIENTGDDDMVVFMWCNEPFDAENPDTYFLEV